MVAKNKTSSLKLAVKTINELGIVLVFPINNKKTPRSLWSEFYPKTKLVWEWNHDGDRKVFKMWEVMKDLSISRDVVYSKWMSGRATFFSRELFVAMICRLRSKGVLKNKLGIEGNSILTELESDSPLSTREIKKLTGLQGKLNEPFFQRGMRQLFSRLLIVGFGEVDDGAFPSLAVGATKSIYEDLWLEAEALDRDDADLTIEKCMPKGSEFRKFFDKIESGKA